jgi:hypothetical protein
MATLTKPARVLGLTGCLGDLGIINTPNTIISNWLFSNMSGSGWKFGPLLIFLLLNLPFLLLLIHRLLASELSLGEEDETKEDLASEEGEEDLTGEEGCWQPIQFFYCPISCLHLCLANFKFLLRFSNRRNFHFLRLLHICLRKVFTTVRMKTSPFEVTF